LTCAATVAAPTAIRDRPHLIVGQVPGMRLQRRAGGMADQRRPVAERQGVREAPRRGVGQIEHHAQMLRAQDQLASQRSEPGVDRVAATAGEGIAMIPGENQDAQTERVIRVEHRQAADERVRSLQGQEYPHRSARSAGIEIRRAGHEAQAALRARD
jgi:hypothetical protein